MHPTGSLKNILLLIQCKRLIIYIENNAFIRSETGMDLKRTSRHHRSRRLPPVTPSECVRDTVFSVVFNQVWSEVCK